MFTARSSNYFTQVGLIESDGAAIQVGQAGAPNTVARYNWVTDVNRTGLRFLNTMKVSRP